ncbi:MAG: CHASE domain-containing protein [Sandaracinaceae bacterium]|nr:CHASE domain-containing protein [Sandaracinaceae bacterium]
MVSAASLDPKKVKRARWLSLLLFTLVSGVLAATWLHQRREWSRSVASQVDLTADQAALRLGDYIHARLLATRGIAVSRLAMASRPSFTAEALIAQREFGGFQAINWMSPEGIIEVVTPERDNLRALGRDIHDSPHARPAFEATVASGQPHVSDAIDLFQGGRGFAVYVPIRAGGAAGFVNGVFRIDPIMTTALRGRVLDGYVLQLDDDAGQSLVALRSDEDHAAATDGRPSSSATFDVLDRRWTLQVWPRDELWSQMRAGRPDVVFLFAIALVALVSALVYVQLTHELQRFRLAEERMQLERRLESTTRMESLGRLAGGVAHDFNNILTVIVGSAELVRRTASPEDPRVSSGLEGIFDAASRAADLTRQLLSFARQNPTPPERLDVNEQLEGLRQLLERLTPEHITLTLTLTPDPLFVLAASSHLSQIFVNLVVNAVDAMPNGGLLSISTRALDGDVVVEVEDTGMGMDSATRGRIFEPFFTTKPEGEGTGLGLATVYGIIQGYGGSIEVRSEPGHGSTFRLRLPAAPPA